MTTKRTPKVDCLAVTLSVKVRIPVHPGDHKSVESANAQIASISDKLKDVLPAVTEVQIGNPSFQKMDAPSKPNLLAQK